MDISEKLSDLKTRRCTVIGLGISNLPLIDFLLSVGATITARDRKTRNELGATADELETKGVRLILGENYLDDLSEDVIFRSPGLRPDRSELSDAVRRGAMLTSEMELFLELTPATVIGITGSDGKTTTTTLTALLLERACERTGKGRRVFVGGNIGTPLLPKVWEMTSDDFAVVELSSFQLQTMRRSPLIAAVTNVTENHLDWHTDMREYIAAKTNIYAHAPNRRLVTNAENPNTVALAEQADRPVTYFSSVRTTYEAFPLKSGDQAVYVKDGWITIRNGERELPMGAVSDILLPGRHNLENYMTAVALTEEWILPQDVRAVATTFGGVPHRLERIRVCEGVTYYNSSIDSTPARTAAALSALEARPIVICGGYDKHLSFDLLADALCRKAKAVVLTGATAPKIRAALEERPAVRNGTLPVYHAPLFEEAVAMARSLAHDGDTVLLSPACASFDAFRNFEERGDTYRCLVESFGNEDDSDRIL